MPRAFTLRDVPDRRALLRLLAGAAATSLAAPALAARAARGDAGDVRLKTTTVRQTVSPGRTLSLYLALPDRARGRQPAVLVAHGAAGLDEATRAAARRIAQAGFVACAPDFLSRAGGTPADAAAAALIVAGLDPEQVLMDAVATIRWLAINPAGAHVFTGAVGAVGWDWGGALVVRAARAPDPLLRAAVIGGTVADDAATPAAVPVLRLPALPAAPAWDDAIAFLGEKLR